jgi:hypothetical protein
MCAKMPIVIQSVGDQGQRVEQGFEWPDESATDRLFKAIHSRAMPAILTTKAEINAWLTAEGDAALTLQRPLPDGAPMIVARGDRTGDAPAAALS